MNSTPVTLWLQNKRYGSGAGYAKTCVRKVPCPVCGAKRFELCRGKRGLMLDAHYERNGAGRKFKESVRYRDNDLIRKKKPMNVNVKEFETIVLSHVVNIGEEEIGKMEHRFTADSRIDSVLMNVPWMGVFYIRGILIDDTVILNNNMDCFILSPMNPFIFNPFKHAISKGTKVTFLISYGGYVPIGIRVEQKWNLNVVLNGKCI